MESFSLLTRDGKVLVTASFVPIYRVFIDLSVFVDELLELPGLEQSEFTVAIQGIQNLNFEWVKGIDGNEPLSPLEFVQGVFELHAERFNLQLVSEGGVDPVM